MRLAFDTIECIVREHFEHITETEAATFTDCVNCLIAFTNNPHDLEVGRVFDYIIHSSTRVKLLTNVLDTGRPL